MADIEEKLMIGTEAGGVAGMITLQNLIGTGLGIRHKSVEVVPVHFSVYHRSGEGKLVGHGFKQAEWHLNGVRDIHWQELYDEYLTSQSIWVYIRTFGEDGKTYKNYLALATRPDAPVTRDHDTNVVLDFTITFTQMVEQV